MQFKRRVFHTLAVEKPDEACLFAERQSGQFLRRVAKSDDLGFYLYRPFTATFLLSRGVNHAQSEGGQTGGGVAQAVTTSQARRQLESVAVFSAQAAASTAGASGWAD